MGALASREQLDFGARRGRRARQIGADRRRRSLPLAGGRQWRLHRADPAPLRRSLGRAGDPRRRAVRSGVDDHALSRTSTTRSRSPIAAWARWLCRCSPSIPSVAEVVRARRRRLSWPHGDPRPDLGQGIDRPRLAPPRPRPWRPRPRRRRRGDGRDPRRHPLHAAHRAPGQPGHARRHRQAMAAGRRQDRGRHPSVPQAHLRA